MGLLLMIVLAVIIVFLLAVVIVKFLPLKMRPLVSLVLFAVSIFLGYKIYEGIMKPIKFNTQKKVRYAKVIYNLRMIRDAEIAYNKVTRNYTKDKNALLQFIDTAKFALTETKNVKVTINTGGGITKDISKRKIDTIGYEPVLEKFQGKDYKNMFKVPGTEKEFEINISMVEKVPGLLVPVFEAKIDKASVLKGMDISLVKQETQVVEADQIKGEFVSVGSLTEVSTGGNWPPSYDKTTLAKKNDK